MDILQLSRITDRLADPTPFPGELGNVVDIPIEYLARHLEDVEAFRSWPHFHRAKHRKAV